MKSIGTKKLNELVGKVEIIDVREVYEYREGHVPTAKNIPMSEINRRYTELDMDKEYYIICQSGGRSASVCMALLGAGYNVINVEGGTGMYGVAFPLEK